MSHTVKVTAFDAFGNVATGYTGTVAFSSSDVHAGLPADYTFTAVDAGIHTFSITLDTAGNQSITAQDVAAGSIAGTEEDIVVSPAAASVLVVSGYPSTSAGTAQSFTVTAQDPYGNTATGYTGTIRFESTDKQVSDGRGLPSDYTFTTGAGKDNGVHTFSATLLTAGTQSITAQDTASSTIAGTQAGISVSPAPAHQLVFAQQPSGTSAGAVISPAVTVLVEDPFGNVVTSDSSSVILTLARGSFEGGSNTVTVNASSGVATFAGMKIDRAGSYSVSATDGSLAPTGPSNSFAISPAAPAQLVFDTEPSSTAVAGRAFSVQPEVFVEDRFGNIETSDSTTVVRVAPGGTAGPLEGTTAVTVSGGVATFTNLSAETARAISITASSGVLAPASSSAIDVAAAPATQLAFTTLPPDPLVAGEAFTLVVAAKDPYGNVDPAYRGDVTVSVAGDPGFTTTVPATDGVATFQGLSLNESASGESIQAVANGLRTRSLPLCKCRRRPWSSASRS